MAHPPTPLDRLHNAIRRSDEKEVREVLLIDKQDRFTHHVKNLIQAPGQQSRLTAFHLICTYLPSPAIIKLVCDKLEEFDLLQIAALTKEPKTGAIGLMLAIQNGMSRAIPSCRMIIDYHSRGNKGNFNFILEQKDATGRNVLSRVSSDVFDECAIDVLVAQFESVVFLKRMLYEQDANDKTAINYSRDDKRRQYWNDATKNWRKAVLMWRDFDEQRRYPMNERSTRKEMMALKDKQSSCCLQ